MSTAQDFVHENFHLKVLHSQSIQVRLIPSVTPTAFTCEGVGTLICERTVLSQPLASSGSLPNKSAHTDAPSEGIPSHHSSRSPGSSSLQSARTPQHNVPLVVICLMLGMLISSLGQMIFATALPTVVGDLGGASEMSWVITIFLLTMTIGMPIYGKLGDQIGPKPLYLIAIVLFLIGSVVGALAHTMATMIIARGIQGLGGGGLMVLSQAIIADVVPPRQRGRYMGYIGAVFGFSSVLGPLLGGFFTDGPGWRWALWFNVPLALIAFGVTAIALQLPRRHSPHSFDVLGALTMAISTSTLILAVTWGGRNYPWSSPQVLGCIASTVLFGGVFVFIELRKANPLIPMSFFRARNFSLTVLGSVMLGAAMFATLSYLPTYIQMVHGLSPTKAGLMMIPMMAGMILTSIVVGQIVTRTGKYKWFPVAGMLIMAGALVLLGQIHASDSLSHFGGIEAMVGVGLGMCMQTLVLIVQNTFPLSEVGTATASTNFFRQIGGALGASVVGSLFMHRLAELIADKLPAIAPQGSAGTLTPGIVHQAPEQVRTILITSYNDALLPILSSVAPLALLSALVLCFVTPERLKEALE